MNKYYQYELELFVDQIASSNNCIIKLYLIVADRTSNVDYYSILKFEFIVDIGDDIGIT